MNQTTWELMMSIDHVFEVLVKFTFGRDFCFSFKCAFLNKNTAHDAVASGRIALNGIQRRQARVSSGDSVAVSRFKFTYRHYLYFSQFFLRSFILLILCSALFLLKISNWLCLLWSYHMSRQKSIRSRFACSSRSSNSNL